MAQTKLCQHGVALEPSPPIHNTLPLPKLSGWKVSKDIVATQLSSIVSSKLSTCAQPFKEVSANFSCYVLSSAPDEPLVPDIVALYLWSSLEI